MCVCIRCMVRGRDLPGGINRSAYTPDEGARNSYARAEVGRSNSDDSSHALAPASGFGRTRQRGTGSRSLPQSHSQSRSQSHSHSHSHSHSPSQSPSDSRSRSSSSSRSRSRPRSRLDSARNKGSSGKSEGLERDDAGGGGWEAKYRQLKEEYDLLKSKYAKLGQTNDNLVAEVQRLLAEKTQLETDLTRARYEAFK